MDLGHLLMIVSSVSLLIKIGFLQKLNQLREKYKFKLNI